MIWIKDKLRSLFHQTQVSSRSRHHLSFISARTKLFRHRILFSLITIEKKINPNFSRNITTSEKKQLELRRLGIKPMQQKTNLS